MKKESPTGLRVLQNPKLNKGTAFTQAEREKYVNCSEAEYIEKVGGLEAIKKLPLPIY